MDMMELQGKETPEAIVLGVVPAKVSFCFGLGKSIIFIEIRGRIDP
jgi:hypothetical protein